MNFTSPVHQSVAMQKTGVPVPPPLADVDLDKPETKRARRLAAEVYLQEVQAQLVVGNADATDVDAANFYQSQVYVAESMVSIERNLPQVAAAAVAAAILESMNEQFALMNEQFALMNAQFAQMHARHTNRFAEQPGDTIVPLPVLPQPGVPVPPLPACFPATRQELMDLTSPDVDTLLEYYGQAPNGSLSNRRAQLVAFLGMPPSL
eukprot:gene18655-13435_t